ncbi:MAG: glycosyltransferase family A protein [Candidatus Bathyarchaeia archaeon]
MKTPLVSIVIPCYNAELFVGEAISSAKSQLYPNIEIIVVDDGSADKTWEIVSSTSGVKCVRQENSGACSARNLGLKYASGEYVKFLDADDLLAPDSISTQVKAAVTLDEKAIIFGGYKTFPNTNSRERLGALRFPNIDVHPCQDVSLVLTNINTPLSLYPKHALEKCGGFNDSLTSRQEWALNQDLSRAGFKFFLNNDFVVSVRHHHSPSRITNRSFSPEVEFLNILKIYGSSDLTIHSDMAHAWSWIFRNAGRQAIKNGFSPECFFNISKDLDPLAVRKFWRRDYKLICNVFGAVMAEKIISLRRMIL